MSSRAVQKKLKSISKKLLESSVLQDLLNTADKKTKASLAFLIDVEPYEDNVEQFREDAESTFKAMAKLKGRSADVATLQAQFVALLTEAFPSLAPSSSAAAVVEEADEGVETGKRSQRKRTQSRHDDSDEDVAEVVSSSKKGRSKSSEYAPSPEAPSNALKTLIQYIIKLPMAEPFIFPVDRKSFPEYYELIQRPVDLTSIKKAIASGAYSSVQEALSDIRLVWANCQQFNADGSDISDIAIELAAKTEEFVQDLLGHTFVLAPVEVSTKKKKQTQQQQHQQPTASGEAEDDLAVLRKKEFSKLLKEIKKHADIEPFLYPVDVRSAPGYLDFVSTPMDLSTVEKSLKAGKYDLDGAAFQSDLNLIFENCIAYNIPESDLYESAKGLLKVVATMFKGLPAEIRPVEVPVKQKPGRKSTTAASVATPVAAPVEAVVVEEKTPRKGPGADVIAMIRKADLGPVCLKLYSIFKTVCKYERVEPFLYPVDLSAAPGYLDFVKVPMDLSTVASKFTEYETSPIKFLSHMRTIFDNCMAYNADGSDLYNSALSLKRIVEDLYKSAMKSGFKAEAEALPPVAEAASSPPAKPEAEGNLKKKSTLVIVPPPASGQGFTASVIPSAKASTPGSALSIESFTKESLQQLLANLQSESVDVMHLLRSKAVQIAKERNSGLTISFPFLTADELFEVAFLGEVLRNESYHNPNYIFPLEYTSKISLRLAVVAEDAIGSLVEASVSQFAKVEFVSAVLPVAPTFKDFAAGGPKFVVRVDGVGLIAESTESPLAAWQAVLSKGPQILRMIGSRLRRCRSVFNRLCCDSAIVPFLEQVSAAGQDGVLYYKTIKSPMWLREVHKRLLTGMYDNEFDFAWDVRLIFQNCMTYNSSISQLYMDAYKLMTLFEALMCNWVYNVQDRSPDDLAVGPWSNWEYLKYFDAEDATENFCRSTGARVPQSELVFCNMCEDQHLPTSVGLSEVLTGKAKDAWKCTRCMAASDYTPQLLAAAAGACGPNAVKSARDLPRMPYSKDDVNGGLLFVPISEFGPGWCQARRAKGQGLKNIFLSPLGYELYSRDEAVVHVEFEKTVNENLLLAREREYQESLVLDVAAPVSESQGQKRRHKKTVKKRARSNRRRSAEEDEEEEGEIEVEAPAVVETVNIPVETKAAAEVDDAGQILSGKLSYFALEDGQAVTFMYNVRTKQASSSRQDPQVREMVTAENLPRSGLFGLDHQEIRRLIELQPVASACRNYVFSETATAKASLMADINSELAKRQLQVDAEEKLQRIMRNEIQYWTNSVDNIADEKDATAVTSTYIEHKAGFATLFPADVNPIEGEIILSVWEFLDISRPVIGCLTLSLSEIIKCVNPLASWLPTLGQAIFDEICYLLTSVLLFELESVSKEGSNDEYEWQSLLQSKPLNSITWPSIASSMIHALTFSPEAVFANHILDEESRASAKKYFAAQSMLIASKPAMDDSSTGDIVCLTLNHPILRFFTSNSKWQHSKAISGLLRSIQDRYTMTIFLSSCDVEAKRKPYPSSHHVLLDMHLLLSGIVELHAEDSLGHSLSTELLTWFSGLLARFCIQIEGLSEDDGQDDGLLSIESLGEAMVEEVEPDSEDLNTLNVENLSGKGQYLHPFQFQSNIPDARTMKLSVNLAKPISYADFLTQPLGSVLSSRLKALQALQTSLIVLRNSDPEVWNKEERLAVLATLVDQGLYTSMIKAHIAAIENANADDSNNTMTTKMVPIGDVPPLEFVKPTKTARCLFTGLDVKSADSSERWVQVPDWLLVRPTLPPNISHAASTSELLAPTVSAAAAVVDSPASSAVTELPSSSTNRTRGVKVDVHHAHWSKGAKSKEVALERAVLSVAAAREFGIRDRLRQNERLELLVRQLGMMELQPLVGKDIEKETAKLHSRIPRSSVLGVDRLGRQYLLLGAQENAPLVPLGRTLSNNMITADPAVLVKEPSGWWGFHNGRHLDSLVNSFSTDIPCEKLLRARLAERMHFTRRKLYSGTLRFKSCQTEWLTKVVRGEVAISNFKTGLNPTGADTCKALEVLWTRCFEVRSLVHFAELHREEDTANAIVPSEKSVRAERDLSARRQKRFRDQSCDENFELHPVKGWLRSGPFARIKDMFASTTASRLLADPTVYRTFQDVMSRSSYRTHFGKELEEESKAALLASAPAVVEMQVEEVSTKANVEANPEATEMVVEEEDPEAVAAVDGEDTAEVKEESKQQDLSRFRSGAASASATPAPTTTSSKVEVRRPLPPKIKNLRPIEQLDSLTGEVLRIYPSGREAAKFMNVSQSGISLCTTGSKQDAYGFKWRLFVGPFVNWEEIEPKQMSYEELSKRQVIRGRRVFDVSTSSSAPSNSLTTYLAATVGEAAYQPKMASVPMPVPPASNRGTLPHVVLAEVPMNARLLKLKAELVSILSIIPERSMKWGDEFDSDEVDASASSAAASAAVAAPAPDAAPVTAPVGVVVVETPGVDSTALIIQPSESVDGTTAPSDGTAAPSDGDGTVAPSDGTAAPSDGQQVQLSEEEEAAAAAERERVRLAEKAERKVKRHQRRKLANEKVLAMIKSAGSAKELFEAVIVIQNAIPPAFLVNYDVSRLPAWGTSLAAVAVRIYGLDRALKYEDWKDIELNIVQCEKPYRPRVSFSPRCLLSSNCMRFLCHDGRCQIISDTSTRYPELNDNISSQNFLNPTPYSSNASLAFQAQQTAQNQQMQAMQYKIMMQRQQMHANALTASNKKRGRGRGGSDEEEEEEEEDDEFVSGRRVNKRKVGLGAGVAPEVESIEYVVPYVPVASEINTIVWV